MKRDQIERMEKKKQKNNLQVNKEKSTSFNLHLIYIERQQMIKNPTFILHCNTKIFQNKMNSCW